MRRPVSAVQRIGYVHEHHRCAALLANVRAVRGVRCRRVRRLLRERHRLRLHELLPVVRVRPEESERRDLRRAESVHVGQVRRLRLLQQRVHRSVRGVRSPDIPGNVRTTGKLPLYLAAGRYILASDVGEASLVLPQAMRVEYRGVVDPEYPARLADRIRQLIAHPERLAEGAANVEIARRVFDYGVLSERVGTVIDSLAVGEPRGS